MNVGLEVEQGFDVGFYVGLCDVASCIEHGLDVLTRQLCGECSDFW